ncbi:MAG: hypothetical protein KAI17_13090 [Thiotrichaceae bacterium]|nr:hypothetical protein [Thiotrichaceae bacterium]
MKNFLLLLLFSSQVLAQDESRETLKLSPQVRIIERIQTIHTIKIGDIQQFLIRPHLITAEELESAPSIIANAQQSILSTQGVKIFVNELYDDISSEYIIVHPGQHFLNPENNEVLAYEAIYLGEAKLLVPGDPATLTITKAKREIKLGDRLLPKEEKQVFSEDFYPHSPDILEEAYIIAVVDEILLIGQNQIVIINKGLQDGIERGHLLTVNKAGREIFQDFNFNDELPKQKAGTLLVFRVFDRVSYALVLTATLSINIFDEVDIP